MFSNADMLSYCICLSDLYVRTRIRIYKSINLLANVISLRCFNSFLSVENEADLMDYPDSDEGAPGGGDRTEIEDSILDTEDMDVGIGTSTEAVTNRRECTGGRRRSSLLVDGVW